jgi:hypothetical protein
LCGGSFRFVAAASSCSVDANSAANSAAALHGRLLRGGGGQASLGGRQGCFVIGLPLPELIDLRASRVQRAFRGRQLRLRSREFVVTRLHSGAFLANLRLQCGELRCNRGRIGVKRRSRFAGRRLKALLPAQSLATIRAHRA